MANPQRSTTVITEVVGDGLGVFDPTHQQSYVLNAPAALVFQQADGQTTPQQLAARLRQKFNVPANQAEQMLWLALDELQKANLLQGTFTTTQAPQPILSRRQALRTFAAVGLSLALLPLVAPVVVRAAEGDVFPTLQCVVNNGNGTYTAYFGYINNSSSAVTIPVDPIFSKNMFTSEPKYRGQPTVFLPGTHNSVFTVVFDGTKITWMIKQDNAARQQVSVDANSGCATPPTTTTTTQPPTTTTTESTTTTLPPTTTTTESTTT